MNCVERGLHGVREHEFFVGEVLATAHHAVHTRGSAGGVELKAHLDLVFEIARFEQLGVCKCVVEFLLTHHIGHPEWPGITLPRRKTTSLPRGSAYAGPDVISGLRVGKGPDQEVGLPVAERYQLYEPHRVGTIQVTDGRQRY